MIQTDVSLGLFDERFQVGHILIVRVTLLPSVHSGMILQRRAGYFTSTFGFELHFRR